MSASAAPPDGRPWRLLPSGPSRTWTVVTAGLTLLGVLLGLSIVALDLVLGHTWRQAFVDYTPTNLAFALTFAPVGGLILSRHPRHRVGWIMLWAGIAAPAQIVCERLALVLVGPSPGPFSEWSLVAQVLYWIPIWAWIPAIVPIITFLPLFFPDGELPTRRWRPLPWVALTVIAVLTVSFGVGLAPWSVPDFDAAAGSEQIDLAVAPFGTLIQVGFPFLGAVALTCLASVIVRFRRAEGVERLQLKWLAFAASVTIPLFVGTVLTMIGREGETVPAILLLTVAVVPIPVAIGVAILRHRLFDIDVVISRSLTAAGLAAFVTLVYVAVVVGLGAAVGARGDTSLTLQVVATALVAVAFQPARRWLQRHADRLVYGHRASPYEVLSSFSRDAAQFADHGLLPRLAQLLADGTGAAPVRIWLRVGGSLRPAAAAGATGAAVVPPDPAPVPVADERLPALGAEVVVPVVHHGELLGALALDKPRGEPVADNDVELLERVAAGVALALRNIRLTAELEDRLVELRASRHRLVEATDDARRRIERDLHDGAQQQLVALKVKLGMARTLAARSEAPRTEALLDQIVGAADAAVTSLRELARGIYPPLLESEGLVAAVEAQARKAPVAVTVHATDVDRYPRDVEVAVYFCVLEALTNAAKYAEPSSVHITLRGGDRLSFSVSDDGRGFHAGAEHTGTGLQGMADRLDTVDGTLEVASRPGHGTHVRGDVPVRSEVPA